MKTKNSRELSAQQKEFVRNIVSDPALFATHILGVSLWDRETEIAVDQSQPQNRCESLSRSREDFHSGGGSLMVAGAIS